MRTKRQIEKAVEELSDGNRDRCEMLFSHGFIMADEPELTNWLTSRGFVVDREIRVHSNGEEDVLLHTTPEYKDVRAPIEWHRDGPTCAFNDVRVEWERETILEDVVESAEHSTEYVEPARIDFPDDPVTAVEGDGWRAVAPRDRVITNPIMRRRTAERNGRTILGPVELPIPNAEEYGLAEVTPESESDSEMETEVDE